MKKDFSETVRKNVIAPMASVAPKLDNASALLDGKVRSQCESMQLILKSNIF